MKCIYCREKEIDWGEWNSKIKCAFESWIFSEDNWNCWMMDKLRDLAEENSIWSDDMNAWIVSKEWEFIYLEWYKSRWTTDKCIDMNTLKPLTFEKAYETTT